MIDFEKKCALASAEVNSKNDCVFLRGLVEIKNYFRISRATAAKWTKTFLQPAIYKDKKVLLMDVKAGTELFKEHCRANSQQKKEDNIAA